MDNSKIIELYMDRSEQAILETSKKYGKYCYYIAHGILQNEEDAKECVNDAYLRVWNSIPPSNPENLQTFLGKIVRNLSLNKLEKRFADKRGGGQVPLALDELAECIPDVALTESIIESKAVAAVIDRFLHSLPTKTRKIFVRRYWYMSAVKEIAEEYGLTESKVTVTLFRTRKKLKEVLRKEGISL